MKENGGGAKYREITAHLRNLIKKGELKPGARLPTARELAKTWHTNPFTVHRALEPLVAEGLIERQRRSGTFVRDPSQKMASVALYCGGNIWQPQHSFYQRLYCKLEELCQERKIRWSLFIESRTALESAAPLPALQKAVDQGEVQGIIASMMSLQEGWLRKFQLPLSILSSTDVQPSQIECMELVLSRLKADGCQTVGLIAPRCNQDWYMVFKNVAARNGLKVDPAWPAGGGSNADRTFEFGGYRLFKDRWTRGSHPDGIFAYPDIAAQGVTIAALELGLQVPRDVRFVYHRNTGIDYLCPWKIPYLVIDVDEVARLLMDHVEAQYRHEQGPVPTIGARLIETSDFSG